MPRFAYRHSPLPQLCQAGTGFVALLRDRPGVQEVSHHLLRYGSHRHGPMAEILGIVCLMLPKGDTVKQIAEKLHISPAARISALPSDDLTLHYCLECISRYTCTQASERPPTMPLICSILLQKPLKTFFFMERHTTPPLGPSTHFRYILHEARSPTPPYGILVEELRDGVWAAFAVFAPFSSDRLADLNVIFSTNQLQLSTPI